MNGSVCVTSIEAGDGEMQAVWREGGGGKRGEGGKRELTDGQQGSWWEIGTDVNDIDWDWFESAFVRVDFCVLTNDGSVSVGPQEIGHCNPWDSKVDHRLLSATPAATL